MKRCITLALPTLLLLCPARAAAQADPGSIPTEDQVGAGAKPAEIAPTTEAPFKMDKARIPRIPDRQERLGPGDVGPDGKITPAINERIEELSMKGGGTLTVPSGTWLSGRIVLRGKVNLHLEDGAVIEFSGDVEDYLPAVFTRHEGVEIMGAGAFIYANGERDIALTGHGTIRGPGMDSPMRAIPNGNSVVENDVPWTQPVAERVCDGREGRTFYRPKAFSPINCSNVLVEDVTFERSLLWNINPVYCENVTIRGATVNSVGVPSGDGIDISSCKDVLIEYCTLSCGDDCFTIKAGRCEDGLRVGRPTEDCLIRFCLAREGHGGITCGSETAGGIRNVYLHDCVFEDTRTAFRFKTRRNRGGTTENITYENVRVRDMREAFTWDLLGSVEYMGDMALRDKPFDVTPLTPTVRDITIRNFLVESTDRLITINGIPEAPCSNVLIENGTVWTNRIVRTMDDARGVTFRNMTVNATSNAIRMDNSRDVTFEDVTFHVPGHALEMELIGEGTSGVTLVNGGERTECVEGTNPLRGL